MYFVFQDEHVFLEKEYQRTDPKETSLPQLGLFSCQDMSDVAVQFQIIPTVLQEGFYSPYLKYDSLDGCDMICLNLIDYENITGGQRRAILYLEKNLCLIFADEPERIRKIIEDCVVKRGEKTTLYRLLYDFFHTLTIGDLQLMDSIEKEILELEQALITSRKRDCVQEIISLRKRLMILKKYYEQFMEVLDGIGENENGIFDKKTLQYFKGLENRNERLYQNVLNLRDYVTQVRESYQAEVDISLNVTMKLFTVITAVFLPLSLIVGWYGMNFEMPEYDWKYGYELVIGLSVIVIVITMVYFKKKKWY